MQNNEINNSPVKLSIQDKLNDLLTGWFDRMSNMQKARLVLVLAFIALIVGLYFLYKVLATIITI